MHRKVFSKKKQIILLFIISHFALKKKKQTNTRKYIKWIVLWLSQRYSTTVSQAIGEVYTVLVSYPSPKKNKVKKSWQRYIYLFIWEKTFEISRFGIEVAEKNMSRTIQQATIQKKSSDKIKVKSILTHWIFFWCKTIHLNYWFRCVFGFKIRCLLTVRIISLVIVIIPSTDRPIDGPWSLVTNRFNF